MQTSVPEREEENDEATREPCSVMIAYQDTLTRNHALAVCNYLAETLGDEIDFEFTWWKFSFFADPLIAEYAAATLAKADLFFVAAHADVSLADEVKQWIEEGLSRRSGHEGMLVALVGTTSDHERGLTPQHNYLRGLAYQAKMDYLPQVVEKAGEGLPDSIGEAEDRATRMTSVLDKILHRRSRWENQD